MRRSPYSLITAALIAVGLLTGCAAALAATGPAADAQSVITITGFAFEGALTVAPGVTVTVKNSDSVPHTLTATDGSFTTATIAAGGSGTFVTPRTAGSYAITCKAHPSMSGTLVVSEATPTTAPTAAASPGPSSSAAANPSPSISGGSLIVIGNFKFSGGLMVLPGAVVTVRNDDTAPHTVTAVDGSFTTPTITTGQTGTFIAPMKAGSYPITCKIHPTMMGTLVVTLTPSSASPSALPSSTTNASANMHH